MATDPTRRGWRAVPVRPGRHVVVVGRSGVAGCFTAQRFLDDLIVIQTYDGSPSEVSAALTRGERMPHDSRLSVHAVYAVPGWALDIVRDIEDGVA